MKHRRNLEIDMMNGTMSWDAGTFIVGRTSLSEALAIQGSVSSTGKYSIAPTNKHSAAKAMKRAKKQPQTTQIKKVKGSVGMT